jgi:hypothetical protein
MLELVIVVVAITIGVRWPIQARRGPRGGVRRSIADDNGSDCLRLAEVATRHNNAGWFG